MFLSPNRKEICFKNAKRRMETMPLRFVKPCAYDIGHEECLVLRNVTAWEKVVKTLL